MSEDHIRIRRHSISQVESYEIFEQDLDAIEREGGNVGLDFQVALFCLTLAVSFLTALLTTTVGSIRVYDTFVILISVGTVLGVVFGIKWFRSRGAFSAILQRIRERQIGPIGDEEHPLRPSEVAQLPAVAAPTLSTPEAQPAPDGEGAEPNKGSKP